MFRKVGSALAGGAFAFGVSSAAAYNHEPALSPKEFRSFPLLTRGQVSSDTQRLEFGMTLSQVTGMEVAGLLVVKFKGEDGKAVIRPYTPISPEDRAGSFELLVKKYPGGKMGTYLHEVPIGGSVEMKGPFKKYDIKANEIPHIGMVAGGTGITPMYQIISYLLRQPEDNTKLTLVYANRTPADILLKNELDNLARTNPRFNIYYVVADAPYNWKEGVGFINKGMLESYLPAPKEGKVFVCGPPGMMKHVSGDKDFKESPPTQGSLSGLLKEQGYSENDVFKF
eukprot:TRINITY_DN10824_c0_g4_i1.p1 TRINITY_DN10824_c0_g4~~TRINITY_DN10824_c0_g4_i1.p1  ORF type:complete len:283 (+),score=110.80 TRINITY_DN10824_c0_g4_i1:52-900(+)